MGEAFTTYLQSGRVCLYSQEEGPEENLTAGIIATRLISDIPLSGLDFFLKSFFLL